jgi:hypothetical protein
MDPRVVCSWVILSGLWTQYRLILWVIYSGLWTQCSLGVWVASSGLCTPICLCELYSPGYGPQCCLLVWVIFSGLWTSVLFACVSYILRVMDPNVVYLWVTFSRLWIPIYLCKLYYLGCEPQYFITKITKVNFWQYSGSVQHNFYIIMYYHKIHLSLSTIYSMICVACSFHSVWKYKFCSLLCFRYPAYSRGIFLKAAKGLL